MDGSSRIYKIPVSCEPIWVASLILCASPPESEVDSRSMVRYSSPTFIRKSSRCDISFARGSAIASYFLDDLTRLRISSEKNFLRLSTDKEETSAMFLSRILTASASFFRRLPLQAGQTFIIMYFSISARVNSESVSFHLRSRFGTTPSNSPPAFVSPYKIMSTAFFGRSLMGTSMEKLCSREAFWRLHQYQPWRPTRCEAVIQGRTAPSPSVRFLF